MTGSVKSDLITHDRKFNFLFQKHRQINTESSFTAKMKYWDHSIPNQQKNYVPEIWHHREPFKETFSHQNLAYFFYFIVFIGLQGRS